MIIWDNWSIYPNPTNTTVQLEFAGETSELIVYDLNGKVMLKELIHNGSEIDLSSFRAGISLFELRTEQFVLGKQVVKG